MATINLDHLFRCTESGEITQRVLAAQTLDNLVSIGLIQDSITVSQINQIRIMVNISRSEFVSRGAYVVRLLSGEYANQVVVGSTTNWDFTFQNIKDTYGSAWLMVFIGVGFAEEDSVELQWEAWIRNLFKNNGIAYSDKYYLNEGLMRQFVDYTRGFINKERINVTFSVSPMITMSANDFAQNTDNRRKGQQPIQPVQPMQQPLIQPAIQQPYQPQYQQPVQQPYQQPYANPYQIPIQQPIQPIQPMPQQPPFNQGFIPPPVQQPPMQQSRQQPMQNPQGGYNWQNAPPPQYGNPNVGNASKQNAPNNPNQQWANPQWNNPPKKGNAPNKESFLDKLLKKPFGSK